MIEEGMKKECVFKNGRLVNIYCSFPKIYQSFNSSIVLYISL